MGLRIDKVIADKMVMVTDEDAPVKIMKAVETCEEESTPPEWIWDPSIEIVVIPWRWIIRDNWWTFIIIIVVYFSRVKLGLIFGILSGATGDDGQTEFSCNTLECLQSIVPSH